MQAGPVKNAWKCNDFSILIGSRRAIFHMMRSFLKFENSLDLAISQEN